MFHWHAGIWASVTGPDGKRHGDGYDKDADVYMHNPMQDPMPNAPSMKMYCVYGVDKPVERCPPPPFPPGGFQGCTVN